ncbi:hypothetical protein [Streptomyces sp. NPDC058955]|uniref:hypothetical protein n=1 Tax=unclassified Streptomyces TaxID=2593676 RepID=UPI003665AE31
MNDTTNDTTNDATNDATSDAVAGNGTVEAVAAGGERPAGRRRGRRILRNALVGLAVLGAAGGGVAYTAVTVDRADRTAPIVAWAEPTPRVESDDPAADVDRGRASTPLSKLLLPTPFGYVLGSDIEGYGNDAEVGAEEAEALLKQAGKGLYGKKRRAWEKEIDKLGLQGLAMRTYAGYDGDVQVEVSVMRMKEKKLIRSFFEWEREFADDAELREGPRIKGYERTASCHHLPKLTEGDEEYLEEQLLGLTCTAYDGEVLVSVTAYATAPGFDKDVAELVAAQLKHIASPGEYV